MSAVEAVIPAWTMGDRIRRARVHAHLEQADVAAALSVSRALVSMWERDLSDPRVGQVYKLAEVTGVSPRWILQGESTQMYESIRPLRLIPGGLQNQPN